MKLLQSANSIWRLHDHHQTGLQLLCLYIRWCFRMCRSFKDVSNTWIILHFSINDICFHNIFHFYYFICAGVSNVYIFFLFGVYRNCICCSSCGGYCDTLMPRQNGHQFADAILTYIFLKHYSDIIMSVMASQTMGISIVCSTVVQAQIKENIKAPRHWLLWGESTGDRWIALTKGQ